MTAWYEQEAKASVFFKYDDDVVVDILEDERLKTFIPLVYRMAMIDDELDGIARVMSTNGVGSPRIKSAYEAFYLTSEHDAGESRMANVVMRKATMESERRTIARELEAIAESIRETLSDEDIDMLASYYEGGKSYEDIGKELYMSRETVRRKFIRMRKELFRYEHE